MNITIDNKAKTIIINDEVSAKELLHFLKQFKDYTILPYNNTCIQLDWRDCTPIQPLFPILQPYCSINSSQL